MAIGGLLSNRNFGSFVGSGKIGKREEAFSHRRSIYTVWYVQGSVSVKNEKLQRWALNGFSSGRLSYSAFVQAFGGNSGYKSMELSEATTTAYPRRRRCGCFVSSDLIRKGQLYNLDCAKLKRGHAYYKSEEYEITDGGVESVKSVDGSSEVVFVEGNAQEASAWLEQIPKRWVIVLLCFTTFLLCNIDRVSYF